MNTIEYYDNNYNIYALNTLKMQKKKENPKHSFFFL